MIEIKSDFAIKQHMVAMSKEEMLVLATQLIQMVSADEVTNFKGETGGVWIEPPCAFIPMKDGANEVVRVWIHMKKPVVGFK